MKVLSKGKRLTHLRWSPNSDSFVYVRDNDSVVVQTVTGSEVKVATGSEPNWLGNDNLVFVKNHEIYSVSAKGGSEECLFDRDSCFPGTSKGNPVGSDDGEKVLFVVRDVKRTQSEWVPEKAYPVRHFFAIGGKDGKATPINSSWYGGKATWLAKAEGFAHSEFDATGGARLHITANNGEDQRIFRGYFPRLSPSQKHMAVVSHNFDNVTIIDLNTWETQELLLPEDLAGGRFNNPAMWISDDELILEAHGTILELSTKSPKKAIRRAKIEITRRGVATMDISPDGKKAIYETRADDESQIVLIDVEEWRKHDLPAPKKIEEVSADAHVEVESA